MEFSVNQIMNYYPKYSYLDDVMTITGKKKLNLFIDLKGCLQSLYQEWAVKYIITQSLQSKIIDTSVFSSLMEYIAFHKIYAKKRNLDLNMYIFFERGTSIYHTTLLKTYKGNRKIGDFFGLDDAKRDLFYKILDKNYVVIDKVCNKIPNVFVIKLDFMEADFIPWYLLNRVLKDSSDSANIIFSSDKDMLQCLDGKNVFQFIRHSSYVKMLSQKEVFSHFLKIDINIPAEWMVLVLAIMGDMGDNIPNVSGIGIGTIKKCINEIITLVNGSMEDIYNRIKEGKQIFDHSYSPSNNALKKILENEETIIRNIKLISFRMLSDYMDNDFPLDNIEKKRKIFEIINNDKKISNAGIFFDALQKSGLTSIVSESAIVSLF